MIERRRHLHRRAGFTLLELLVALAVFGFVMAGLAQGVSFGFAAWHREERATARFADLDTVDRALRILFGHIDPGAVSSAQPVVRGGPNEVRFLGTLPEGVAAERMADMELRVDERHRLLLDWRPRRHVTEFASPPAPTETEILTGVDHIEIGYRQSASSGMWRDSWSQPTSPELIRIRIVFLAGDGRDWPAFLIPRLLDAAAP